MARRITIPIANHEAEGVCTWHYIVQYRIYGADGYSFTQQMHDSPLVVDNLLNDTLYEFTVTRYCYNDISSTPYTFQIDTTLLDAPTDFTGTPVAGTAALTWNDMPDADSYRVQRSATADFTTATTVYEGTANSYDDEGLSSGTYYYRIQSVKVLHANSTFATLNITIS
jgi:hypothetical protein